MATEFIISIITSAWIFPSVSVFIAFYVHTLSCLTYFVQLFCVLDFVQEFTCVLFDFFKHDTSIFKANRQPAELEKILTSYISDRGLKYKIYKELQKLDIKEIEVQINKCAKEMDSPQKKKYHWPITIFKSVQHSKSSGKCK